MYDMTDEDIKAWNVRHNYELAKLAEWGWTISIEEVPDPNNKGETYKTEVWTSPTTGKKATALYGDNYTSAVSEKIREKGFRDILELKRLGKKEWDNPVERWALYQSPTTNRIYMFLEVQNILEHDWDEDKVFPDYVCEHTKIVNELVGPDFTGDTIRIWFYLEENNYVHSLWEEKDGDIVETKTIRKIKNGI